MPWPKGTPIPPEMLAKRKATLQATGARRKKPVTLDGVRYWKCGRCAVFKPEADFYIDGKTAAGVASQCKKCHIEGSIRTRDADNARRLGAEHMRRARESEPEKFRAREREASQKRRLQSPEKVAARAAVNNALKRGAIVKPAACEACGEEKKLTGHHEDYGRPLSVQWLCYACHGKQHRLVEFDRITAADAAGGSK